MLDSLRWNVPRDMWVLQQHARAKRVVRAKIDGEPQRKGSGGKRTAPVFQRAVIERMRGRYPFKGPVALDLHLICMGKNPPSIHQLAKHVLDVLGKSEAENIQPGRRSILYYDDRQVKLLYVDLDQKWQKEPSIDPDHSFWKLEQQFYNAATFLSARPVRDAMTDLSTAYFLRGRRGDSYSMDPLGYSFPDSDPFEYPEDPGDVEIGLRPLPRFPGSDEDMLAFLDEANRFDAIRQMQEHLLAAADASFATALAGSLYETSLSDGLTSFGTRFREQSGTGGWRLSDLLTVPLPGLPHQHGAAAKFAAGVREQLENFKAKNSIFRSLLVPVKLTFVVVPSEQGKDLDNIALTALPIAHEVLRPHIEPYLLSPTYKHASPEPRREEALKRLRSLNAYSVRAYQVIELPRMPSDPPQGQLRLSLGRHTGFSLWHQAAELVEGEVRRYERNRPWGTGHWDLWDL